MGDTCAPDNVNKVSTPCARATATARCPPWPSIVSVMGATLSGAGSLRLRGLQELRVGGSQRVHQHQQQVGTDLGRLGAEGQLEVQRPEERLRVAALEVGVAVVVGPPGRGGGRQ